VRGKKKRGLLETLECRTPFQRPNSRISRNGECEEGEKRFCGRGACHNLSIKSPVHQDLRAVPKKETLKKTPPVQLLCSQRGGDSGVFSHHQGGERLRGRKHATNKSAVWVGSIRRKKEPHLFSGKKKKEEEREKKKRKGSGSSPITEKMSPVVHMYGIREPCC